MEPVSDAEERAPCALKSRCKRKREKSADSSVVDIDSKRFKTTTTTHLEEFFSSYPKYEYDPAGPVSQQFRELRKVYKWRSKDAEGDHAYTGYNRAMGLTFSQNYGDDVNSLESWHKLCRTVELFPIPDSLEDCKRAIEDAHVNLVDLVDVHSTGEPVHRFETEHALSVYTRETGKIFPSKHAYKSKLLTYLLR
ncbi:hypothetical protein B0H10DRAFT_1885301, partial [Mycena sp. CBHHK59/15]